MRKFKITIDLRDIKPGHFSAVVNDDPAEKELCGLLLNEVSGYHEPDTTGKLYDGEVCETIAEIKFRSPSQIRAVMGQLVWLEAEMERVRARDDGDA